MKNLTTKQKRGLVQRLVNDWSKLVTEQKQGNVDFLNHIQSVKNSRTPVELIEDLSFLQNNINLALCANWLLTHLQSRLTSKNYDFDAIYADCRKLLTIKQQALQNTSASLSLRTNLESSCDRTLTDLSYAVRRVQEYRIA